MPEPQPKSERAVEHRRFSFIEHFFAWIWGKTHGMLEKVYGKRKNELFATLQGKVLEIGAGTGINFRHFPAGLEVVALEPNPFMHPYLEASARESGMEIEIQNGVAEALAAPDESFDAVVSTLVLCSVDDPQKAIQEILRVLRPGGAFYFIEHVAAPRGTALRALQNGIRPVWRCVGDGCNPNRETWALLEAAGFSHIEMDRTIMPIPVFPVRPHIIGKAVK